MKNKKIIISIIILIIVVAILCAIFLLSRGKSYDIKITIPAGSNEAFIYSEEELLATKDKIIITSGKGLGDSEVILKPIEAKEENVYKATYITHAMPVEMSVEKGTWFKLGVNVQNPTDEDIVVYVNVTNVELRTE